ncbi:SIMPL domain-containing protein [Aristaeella lactis]|uniref:Uncharacterized protein n=1 Tax=Aristaeella lactis TaxID=3046383 RepID=A0AC61PKM7_9FIRM|nr:SIMPL domain-containing protein [Aristaeella lactis]QUA51990.1 SIMPL domain-containing protein [Aristaeella lactis]SMC54542.1 hypothetical protein SAMN06297397_1361 [Aristaeella lactis]
MRKLIALILVMVLSLFTFSALADSSIVVTGTGETYIPADTAVVSLGVSARNADALKAQSEVNEVIARIRAALTDAGLKEEDINTGYVNLYGVYDYSGYEEKLTGYSASSSLAVLVKDISRVGEVIDLAFGAGANMLDGVSFSASDDSAARAESLKAALAEAKEKAAVLAEAAGMGEPEIESIQETGFFTYDNGTNRFVTKAAGAVETDAATIIQAAKICVSATVTVTFKTK